jgi:hypothetical protein
VIRTADSSRFPSLKQFIPDVHGTGRRDFESRMRMDQFRNGA